MAALRPSFCVVVFASLSLLPGSVLGQAGKTPVRDLGKTPTQTLPLVFERNQGQYPEGLAFVGRTERYSVAIGDRDVRFALPGAHGSSQVVLSLRGSQGAEPVGLAEVPFRTNYFLGPKATDARTGIHNYSRVGLRHAYPGIDVQFYASGNTIEHDFMVAPGADPSLIAMEIAAQGKAAALNSAGDLLVAGEEGELELKKPVAYQLDAQGKRHEVAAAFVLAEAKGPRELRFRLGDYDHSRELVIDPVIQYGSFFDGKSGSTATALTTDAAGNVYLTGYTHSAAPNFGVDKTNMAVPAAVRAGLGGSSKTPASVFVVKFNAGGSDSSVAWMSYFGGTEADTNATSIALQAGSNPAYLAIGGSTKAGNIPITALNGASGEATLPSKRGFVASFTTATGSLAASAYLDSTASGQSNASTEVNALAMDTAGNVYAAGSATGFGLPTTANAVAVDSSVLQSTASKGFVYALTPALAAGGFVSYVSGDQVADTNLTSIAVDPSGNLYVGGYTAGSFPKAGAYSPANMYKHSAADSSGNDAFVAELVPGKTATAIRYSTWLSGSGDEKLNALALDASGNLYVFGQTASADLLSNTTYTSAGSTPVSTPAVGQSSAKPVTAVFPAKTGTATLSGFAAKLDPNGQPLVVTYLGGAGDDVVTAGGVDKNGMVYAAGSSSSAQALSYSKASLLPSEQDMTGAGQQHGFVLQMPADLSTVKYVANLGGSTGPDTAVTLALDGAGNTYAGGNITSATAYTSSKAFQAARSTANGTSAYLAKIPSLLFPFPVTLTGVPCPTALTQPNQPTGCPDPIAFPNGPGAAAAGALPVNLTYSWQLTANMQANPLPSPAVVTIPPAAATSGTAPITYQSIVVTDTTTSTDLSSSCALASGTYVCTFATYPVNASGTPDTITIVLSATLTAEPSGAPNTIAVSNTFSDTTAVTFQTVSDTSNVVLPALLTIGTSATPTPGGHIFTTSSPTNPPANNTLVSYYFKISNDPSAGDASNVNFTFPSAQAGFNIFNMSLSAGAAGSCVPSTGVCTITSIPKGTSVTVALNGTYPDIAGTAGEVPAPEFDIAVSGSFSYPTQHIVPGFTLRRGVHLVPVGSFNASPNSDGNFHLGDTITYTIPVKNIGPSATIANADTVTFTYPASFTPNPVPTTATCTATTCTLQLSISTALPSGGSTNFILTGTFPDNAANASVAVTPPTTENFGLSTALSTAVPPQDFDSGQAAPGDTVTSGSVKVERVISLALSTPLITLSTAYPCAPSLIGCLYMLNGGSTNDHAMYTFTLNNTGTNTAEGVTFTIFLPSAPPNPGGTNHALVSTTPTPTVTATSGSDFGTPMTCAAYTATSATAAASNKITCTGNLPPGTLVVKGSLTADAGATPASATVPTGVTSISTSAGGGTLGSLSVAVTGVPSASSSVALPAVEIDRAAHLVTTVTTTAAGTGSPINLDETGTATAGTDDVVNIIANVGNTNLDAASGTLTYTLPAYFRVTTAPPATCTLSGGGTVSANYTTGATPPSVTCPLGTLAPGTSTPSSGPTAAVLGTPAATISFAGKFLDNGTGADVTGATAAAKLSSLAASVGSASATLSNSEDAFPGSNDANAAGTTNVQRLVHMYLSKSRNATVAAAPATFADTADPNLDEKKTGGTFGVNDEIEYDLAVANGGVNKALGVQFTDTLPPYFTMVNAYLISPGLTTNPDTGANVPPVGQLSNSLACFVGTTATGTPLTLPYSTGAGGQAITCTVGTAANPLAVSNGAAVAGDFKNASSVELVYQGKFQDNAASGGADNLPAGTSTYSVTSAVGEATVSTSKSIDNGPATDRTNTAVSTYRIQRAAHLQFGTQGVLQLMTTEAALTQIGGVPVAAQAEPSVSGGNPVFNCLRYKVYIQNAGPNASRAPQVVLTTPTGFNLASTLSGATSTPGSDTPLTGGCPYGTNIAVGGKATVNGSGLAPLSQAAGSSVVVDADGYFGLNTLTSANSQGGFVISYAAPTDPGVNDSNKPASATGLTGAGLTVVNTPSGNNFIVKPFSATATQPAAVTLAAVGAPGATTLTITNTFGTLPSGVTKDPRYQTSMALYQKGATNPQFYTMSTSAATVTGNTAVCFTNPAGGALPDGFAKPERALLWALLGLPSGSNPTALASITNLAGDSTTSVTPLAGTYVVPGLQYNAVGGHTPVFPATQAQPASICGHLNGFATAATPVVFAALEPVNLPPYIIANTGTITQLPGKGVSEVAYLFPTSHDYNDSDPCYAQNASGVLGRTTCDDNLVLTTRLFGADSLVPAQSHIYGPLTPDQAATYSTTVFEVQAGENFYPFVTDQLGELNYQAANGTIAGAGTANPCDPGPSSSNTYHQGTPCTKESALTFKSYVSADPAQSFVTFTNSYQPQGPGGADIAQIVPSVNGGSSPLIVIEKAIDPTIASPLPVALPLSGGSVTAGQTLGFLWLMTDFTAAGTYNLSCYEVDANDHTTKIAFAAGISCQFPATNTLPNNPAIYIVTQNQTFAQNSMPGWQRACGIVFAGLFVPFLLFRRRLSYGKQLVVFALLSLAGAAGLTGCGSGSGSIATSSGTPAGTYWFRVAATPTAGAPPTYTSTAFSVTVTPGS